VKDILNKVVNLFENLPTAIFSIFEMERILKTNFNKLVDSSSLSAFIEYLSRETKLKEIRLNFPSRPIIKYTWGEIELYRFILSLKDRSYFSHQTAMFINRLIKMEPNTIYLNFEQPQKRKIDIEMLQENIDMAFKLHPRVTKSIVSYKGSKICLVNGKQTNRLGVKTLLFRGSNISVTKLERTLIDVVVRPQYSGGIKSVLKAYQNSKNIIDSEEFWSLFTKLDYKYPYQQAIGFYAERAGFDNKSFFEHATKKISKFDFYLCQGYKQSEMSYSKKWKIFYPKSFTT
jgi:predicted transcriptional regulator of viral defense system